MKNRNPHKESILASGPKLATIAGAFLCFCLLLFYVGIPYMIKVFILKEVRLVEGSPTWEKWVDAPFPVYIKFYIFNVTNVEEAEMGGKFKLQDVGPYVWEERRIKQVIEVDEEEDTVRYKEVVWYYFRRDLSVGNDDDQFNIVNAPFISASTLIYKLLYTKVANYVIDFFINMDETFVLRDVKVKDMVFNGVELGETYKILAEFNVVDLPEEFIEGTFAFYNGRNGTPSREFKVDRGVKNYETFGTIMEYDGKKEIDFWTDKNRPADQQYCNRINGSDGSLFAPFVTKDRILRFFSPDICRSAYLRFSEETDFHGIPAFAFIVPEEVLTGPHLVPQNQCFCKDAGSGLAHYCDGNGILRIQSCKRGIPIVLSLAHFIHASKRFTTGVEGVSADPEKHDMNLILEPNTGAMLQVEKKIQINIEFQRLPGIHAYSNISEAFIPIFWVNELVSADEKYLSEIRDRLITPLEILNILKPLAIALCAVLFVLGIVFTLCHKKSQKELLSLEIDY